MNPIRIAYLLKKFPRLSETFVLNEILRQEELGTQVHVFSRRAPDDEPRHPQLADLRAEVEELPSTRGLGPWIALFDQAADEPELFARVGQLARELAAYEHDRIPGLFAEALYLLRRTRDLEIEHVHVHFATDAAIVAMILSEIGGPPYSVTAHAKDIYRSTVDPRLLSRIVSRSSFTVTVCDANVEFLTGLLEEQALSNLRRLYNGISLEQFHPNGDTRRAAHVLAVGRLVPKKGFDVLIEALARIAASGRQVETTIVGEGEERARLEALVRERGLAERVTLTGGLDQGRVREHMADATLMVLPCVVGEDGNRDALPTVLLESLAVGLPIVSTPVTGVPEILDGGRAGVLVPQRDADATARAIEELLDDPARRAALAAHGLEHVARHFEARMIARTLASWFAESRRAALECA